MSDKQNACLFDGLGIAAAFLILVFCIAGFIYALSLLSSRKATGEKSSLTNDRDRETVTRVKTDYPVSHETVRSATPGIQLARNWDPQPFFALTFDDVVREFSGSAAQWENVTFTVGEKYGGMAVFQGDGVLKLGNIKIPEQGAWCCWIEIPEGTDLEPMRTVMGINGAGIDILKGNYFANFHDGENAAVGSSAAIVGEWTHLAINWGHDRRQFWVNGELMSESGYTGKPRVSEYPFIIGARWTGQDRHFIGSISEILFFDRFLSPQQIRAIAGKLPDKTGANGDQENGDAALENGVFE